MRNNSRDSVLGRPTVPWAVVSPGVPPSACLMYLWKLSIDPDKALAVYATDAGVYQYRISTGIQQIIKLTDHDAEAVKRAYLLADYPQNIKNISKQRK